MATNATLGEGKSSRVLVAVEDSILQVGLATILDEADDLQPVGSVGTPEEVRDAVGRLDPDVVLLDVSFRRRDESLVPDLGREHPGSRVLVLVDHSEEECALRYLLVASRGARLSEEAVGVLDDCCLVSLRANAWGCLPKGSDPGRVLTAIRTVASGEIAAAPWLGAVLRKGEPKTRAGWAGEHPVTARELEVIAMIARGLNNREVAQELGIQVQTVKNHLGRIMKKLGLNSRLEIGVFAVKHNVSVLPRPERGGSTEG